MSDFFQSGVIATFHRLKEQNPETLEADIIEFSQNKGITLVLPSLFSELYGPGLKTITEELKKVKYLQEIVVTLGPTTNEQFPVIKEHFAQLPQKVSMIWNSGSRIEALYDELTKHNLNPGPDGKGRSAWLAYGYILAKRDSRVIALHDCDIITYTRSMLDWLVYPVVSDKSNYEFCKGYYPRITDKMHGRATRLFVTPLIRALMKVVGYKDILRYFNSFRYILAGEFSMTTELASINRIPADWGLEVGVLAEIYRNSSLQRICQSELCDNYEHKHQDLSADDKNKGLNKMAIDIAKSFFRTLAAEGVVYNTGFFKSLQTAYQKEAEDFITRYRGDAMINGLQYDQHEEEFAVEVFTNAIKTAAEIIIKDPLGPPLIPNWTRVFSAIPDFDQKLLDAVGLDNQ
ncbi:MAG: glycosyl transferase [candidate division Zixibacteria bacterium]|nr:glycosyl transferase [candidate division Zixibacteria bacterium]